MAIQQFELALSTLDSASSDAFGRFRVSTPQTVFDSQLLWDAAPLIWDDSEETGSGTTSIHNTDEAAVTMSVGATTAGKRTRQTFMRHNYQPGKSQLAFATGILLASGGGTGIVSGFGLYDDNDGIFLRHNEGTVQVVQRSSASGSTSDNAIPQAQWNLDTLDGEGDSQITIDWTKTQVLVLDYGWLGVGRVRCGVVIDGVITYFHKFLNANSLETVYMSTPNLPLRYQIENDGTGVASTMMHICSTIVSEGGSISRGKLKYISTAGTSVEADDVDTIYALVGIRLKSTHLDASIWIQQLTILIHSSGSKGEWLWILNPTVAGTFTYGDETNSALQSATGATANTVTGGTIMDGGYGETGGGKTGGTPVDGITYNDIRLGSAIDGTPDAMVLCWRPLDGANQEIEGGISLREVV